jgi:DNA-3-methyladenine glycosylase I
VAIIGRGDKVEISMARCGWVNEADALYCHYHDTEWGVPVRDDRTLWELLCLESFQAGLSWITILRKRNAFRAAFAGFKPAIVANFNNDDIERLMSDAGIVRSRLKIVSVIRAAQIYEDMTGNGESFAEFVWGGPNIAPVQNAWSNCKDIPVSNAASHALSERLKTKGFKFCGPVICLAFMQAAGLVNDHEIGCPRYLDVSNIGSLHNALR